MKKILLFCLIAGLSNLVYGYDLSHVIVYWTYQGSNQQITVYAEGSVDITRDAGTPIDVRIYKSSTAPDTCNFFVACFGGESFEVTSTNTYEHFYNVAGPHVNVIWNMVNIVGGLVVINLSTTTQYPDIVPWQIKLNNSSNNPGNLVFQVGEEVHLFCMSGNIGPVNSTENRTGFYIGTSSSHYGKRVGYDIAPGLPQNHYVDQSVYYTFTSADIGTRYFNVFVDYLDQVYEGPGENNNKESWGSFTVVDVSSITITSPNGGENWQAGTSKNISWTSSNVPGNVKIELFKGGSLNSTIASSVSNSGSYSWTIPAGQTPASDYKVKISSVSTPSIHGFSNNNFTITGPSSITVNSPNGGENWQRGTTQNITWTSSNVSGNVKIELFKGGSFNSTIANSVSNNGSFSWNIPSGQTAGTDYKVKISSVGTPGIHDFSNNNFTISAQPYISIISPAGGEAIEAGSSFNIHWEDNINENVRIELWKGNDKLSNIANSVPSNGTYAWQVPGNLASDNDYRVKIVSVNTSSLFSMGNNFTINNYLMGGIHLKIIETNGTNNVKKIGYQYSYRIVTTVTKKNVFNVSTDGTVFLTPPSFPSSAWSRKDFLNEILLYDINDKLIGHIPFSYSFDWEGMHTRHAVLFFHNDAQICSNPGGPNYFPYHKNSPNNLNGKTYSYYKYDEYPVSMLIPPHHNTINNLPQGYRFPANYNLQPLLFVHGLTGTFSYQTKFGADPQNTSTKGDQVSYWYHTERLVNHWAPFGNRIYHAWQFYYPNEDDLRHCGLMLKKAIDYLYGLYSPHQKKIGIVAHSMGGLVTMEYMTTNPDNTYKVEKVLLSQPPIHGSLAANRIYHTESGLEIALANRMNMDRYAPCYRDMSIGSDFLYYLHNRDWSGLSNRVFVIMGLTDSKYRKADYSNKPVINSINQLHEESLHHDDGIVSFSSVSLVNKNIGFAGFYGNHDDGKFGGEAGGLNTNQALMPDLIKNYFAGNSNLKSYCTSSDGWIDVYVEANVDGINVVKPLNQNLNNLSINKPNVDFHKGMITLLDNSYSNNTELYLTYRTYVGGGTIMPTELVITPYEGGDYLYERIGRFIKNDKANQARYYFSQDRIWDFGLVSVSFKSDCGFEYNFPNIPIINQVGWSNDFITLNYNPIQHKYITLPANTWKSGIANESTPTKGIIPGLSRNELLVDLFVDDQASTIDFHLYSDRAFFNSIPYHLTLLSPDGTLIDSTSANVSYQNNPLTSVKTLTVNNPMPGKWQVLPLTDPLWVDSLQYISKGVLASEIKSKSLIEQSGHDIETPIELSGKIIIPNASLLNNDSLNAYMILKRSLHVYDTVHYNGIQISDTTVVFNFEFACDSIGIYLYEMVFNGVYNNYRFERAVYGDFRADDLSPNLFIPNQHLNPVYSWAEVSLPHHLYCQSCNFDSLTFDVTLLSSTLDTNMYYSYSDSTQRFRVSAGNEFPGEATFKAEYFMNDSTTLADTFQVIYSIPCKYPAYLDVSHVTTNSAKLIWTPAGDENEWDVIWGLAGFDLHTQGTLVEALNDTLLDIAGLETGTTYSYYVKAVCSENDKSFWEGPRVFSTHQSCPGIPSVTWHGKTYNTILIGEQCWLSENLDVGTMIPLSQDPSNNGIIEKYCYDDNPANCEIYGGLYTLDEALQYNSTPGSQGICPPGWHIPTNDDWVLLEGTVDSEYSASDSIWYNWHWEFSPRGFDAGKKLKSSDFWDGDDEFGFNALPGGAIFSNWAGSGDFYGIFDQVCYGANAEWPYDIRILNSNTNTVDMFYGFVGVWTIGSYYRCIKTDYSPPISCATPSGLNLIETIPNGAKVGWTPQGNEHAWDIAYGFSGFDIETEGVFISGVNSNPVTLVNLEYETEYDFYVRASCWDNTFSEWAGPFSFSIVLPTFPPPSDFNAVASGQGALLTWSLPETLREGMNKTINYHFESDISFVDLSLKQSKKSIDYKNNARNGSVVLNYDNENNSAISLGSNGGQIYIAARFPSSMVADYYGFKLSSIEIYIESLPISSKIVVWGAGSDIAPGNILYEQPFIANPQSWNSFSLNNPIFLDGNDIWIGCFAEIAPNQYVLGVDAGPAHPDGDWLWNGQIWTHLYTYGANLNRNWNIRGVLEPPESQLNLTGFNIYRDTEIIASVDAQTFDFVDSPLSFGTYNYELSTLYGEPFFGESEKIGPIEVIISNAFSITGAVNYRNQQNTPLANSIVYLFDESGVLVGQTTTNSSGEYEFAVNSTGNYTITASSNKPWGGLNLLDVLRLRQYFAFQYQMDDLQKLAANVDQNQSINLLDLLYLRRKLSFQAVPQWTAPDYVFEITEVEVTDSIFLYEVNIKGLCSGDIDGSYIPQN